MSFDQREHTLLQEGHGGRGEDPIGAPPAELIRILEAGGDALAVCDTRMRYVYLNDAALRIVGKRREEMVGYVIPEVFPGFETTVFWEVYTRAVREQALLTIEDYFEPLDTWFDIRVIPLDDFLYIHFRDVTALKRAEAESRAATNALRASEERLRDVQARMESALLAGDIATWSFDVVNDRVVADANLAALFSVDPQAAAGGKLDVYLRAIHEEDRPRVVEAIGKALESGNQYEAEYRVVLPNGFHRWLVARGKVERNASGQAVLLPGVVVDVTERIKRERRGKFLGDLTTRTRALLVPEEILYETAQAVGQYTNADRCLYFEIDEGANTLTVRRDFVQNGASSIAGVYPLDAFGPSTVQSLRAGNVTASEDVEADPRIDPEHRVIFRALGFRAFLCVPLHKEGRWVAAIVLHATGPRVWVGEEADLLAAVAEQTWLAVENARLYRAMQEEVAEHRETARQQAQFAALVHNSSDFIGIAPLDRPGVYINVAGRCLVGLPPTGDLSHVNVEDFFFPEDRSTAPAFTSTLRGVALSVCPQRAICPTSTSRTSFSPKTAPSSWASSLNVFKKKARAWSRCASAISKRASRFG